jgi:Predicted dioxygenase
MAPRDPVPTVVVLGTNHGAAWLDGVAVWEAGGWRTPLGDLAIDVDLAEAIVELGPPFAVDRPAHLGEHSIEVQLPLLQTVRPGARIVPLSVAAGTGEDAIAAGGRLGELLARRRAAGQRVLLAISSDMAHYPPSTECDRVTAELLPSILRLDPVVLARDRKSVV